MLQLLRLPKLSCLGQVGFLIFGWCLNIYITRAQNVGINTDGSSPDASAILDLKASDRGLLIPRVSLTNVNNSSPVSPPVATGLLVYNTNPSVTGGSGTGFYYWEGQWIRLDNSNGDWRLTGNTGTSPASNFLGTTDAQDLVFRTNNTERMRILSGGNVGVGTAAPSYPLTVERDLGVAAGQQILAGFTRLASGAGNGGLLLGYEGDGSAVTRSFIYSTGNQRDLVFQNFDGGLQNRMIIRGTGDVGIGTLAPTHRLHVNGAVRAENGFLANDGTAGVPAYRFNADTDVGMFRPAANQIGFAMDGVEKVRFNGNAADVLVGINTTSPTAPIDFVRTTDNSMLVGTNYGNAPNYDFRRAQGTPGAPTVLGMHGVMARLRAFGYDGAAFQPAAQITFEVDAGSGANDMPGRIQFFTTPDGSTTLQERMRINNAGVIRFNAYTTNGILKTSGGDGTLVTGAVNLASTEVTGTLPVANGGTGVSSIPANAVVLGNGTSPITTVAPGAAGNVLMSNGTTWTSTSGSGQFILNQNATDQTGNFRITGTGRANTSFESPVYTRADAGTVAIRPNTNSTTAIQLQNAGGSSILNVDATNSRVGIGNANPGHVLHVSETGNTGSVAGIQVDESNAGQALVINESGTGAGLLINASDDGGGIVSTVSATVSNSVVGHQFIDARQTTTAGLDKIAVDIQSTGSWSGAGNANNALNVLASGGTSNVGINVTVSGGTTNYAGLFNGGNVGIGTTTPAHVLHVVETGNSGTISGIQVDESNAGQALVINEAGGGAGIIVNASDLGGGIISTVTSSSAVTSGVVGHQFYDQRTSTTNSINKIAVDIQSTGTWSGASSVNTALNIEAQNGTTNIGLRAAAANGTNNYAAIFNPGLVGIGTTTPQYPLDVSGSSNLIGTGTYGILSTSGASSQTGNYNINISINASQAIRTAAAFYAFSDKRIKNQIEPIDPLQALAVVSSLNPVLYNYIDTLFRKPIKSLGFIAQEVENLIPQAVGITQEFLPNIMEEVSLKKERDGKIYFTSSKELPIHTEIKAFEPHGGMLILKVGNKLDQNTYELVGPVAPESDKIFLYGSQINDFRNLDYDKIFTYGIAAIKGLIMKIEALERENRELREKVDEILIKNNFEAKK